jgi:hypothetical protein
MRAVGNHRPFFLRAVSRLHLPVVTGTVTLPQGFQESFMRILTALALCLGLLVAAPVVAQDDPGLERRTEMAERYLHLTVGDDMRPLIDSLIDQELAGRPDLTAEQREWYRDNGPIFFATFMDALIADLAPRYASTMTEAELAAAIEFYSSPLGQSLVRKELTLQLGFEAEMYAAAEALAADIEAKYCAAFDCDTLTMALPSVK